MTGQTFSPTLLLLGALMFGLGLYLIQRGRFLIPAMMSRSLYLRERPRLARTLVMLLLLLGTLFGGLGCRILFAWLF
jgi:LPXTG-motif cell wall-anchored protein